MQLKVREITPQDRQSLANLIHFEMYVHRHLDWRTPLEWIGYKPYLVAEHQGRLVGALACPLDLPEVAWIRLLVVDSTVSIQAAWQALWEAAKAQLEKLGSPSAAAIVTQDWLRRLLEASGFAHTNNVVVLQWEAAQSLPAPQAEAITIRTMTTADLEAVERLDHAAFKAEWQNSAGALKLAYNQAALASVACNGQKLVGYQISTNSPAGGHLARLAVHPSVWGKGIGYALVYDLLEAFQARGVRQVTVNTQQDNAASLALYARAGFIITDEHYQVYQFGADQK